MDVVCGEFLGLDDVLYVESSLKKLCWPDIRSYIGLTGKSSPE